MKSFSNCLMVLCLTLPGGCTISRQVEGLEAQLRQQEDEIQRLAGDLNRMQIDLQASRQEASQLRNQLAQSGETTIPPEQAELFYRVSGLTIDRYQTSFLAGETAGTGQLNVLLTPIDQLKTALRIPGEVELLVYSTADESRPLDRKTFPAADIQKQWTSGWTTSGFLVQLPLDLRQQQAIIPAGGSATPATTSTPEIRIVATFRTLDGREFKASQTLSLPLTAAAPTATPASEEQFVPIPPEFRQTSQEPPEDDPVRSQRVDTSDARTIDEFPVLR